MNSFSADIINLINQTFEDEIIKIIEFDDSTDIFIDCLKDPRFEVTMCVSNGIAGIGKIEKDSSFGDFSSFEIELRDFEAIKTLLLKCKNSGEL